MSKYAILQDRIVKDLSAIGIPVCFELLVKDYSKSFYGCYRPNTNRIYLYYYEDEGCNSPYTYEHLFRTAVHESVHAIQWNDPDFVRVKGVMHNEEFHRMFEHYMSLAEELVFREKVEDSVDEFNPVHVVSVKRSAVRTNTSNTSLPAGSVLRVACRR